MATPAPITLEPFLIGDTDRIRVTARRDGAAWDLSDGGITLTFEKPDRSTRFVREMEAENAAGGVFVYDTDTDEIDTLGYWTLGVKITDGDVVKRYPGSINFLVRDEP